MAITITWATKVINVPKSYLTLVSGTSYTVDTEAIRLDVKALEASEEGMTFLDAMRHSTEKTVAGVTYARFIEIINGYKIEFEDGMYGVTLTGSNNNFFEEGVLMRNQVSVIPGNAAGLINPEGQNIRDAMLLAPSGAAAADSVDGKLDRNRIDIINTQF